jgi:hypothetical protein
MKHCATSAAGVGRSSSLDGELLPPLDSLPLSPIPSRHSTSGSSSASSSPPTRVASGSGRGGRVLDMKQVSLHSPVVGVEEEGEGLMGGWPPAVELRERNAAPRQRGVSESVSSHGTGFGASRVRSRMEDAATSGAGGLLQSCGGAACHHILGEKEHGMVGEGGVAVEVRVGAVPKRPLRWTGSSEVPRVGEGEGGWGSVASSLTTGARSAPTFLHGQGQKAAGGAAANLSLRSDGSCASYTPGLGFGGGHLSGGGRKTEERRSHSRARAWQGRGAWGDARGTRGTSGTSASHRMGGAGVGRSDRRNLPSFALRYGRRYLGQIPAPAAEGEGGGRSESLRSVTPVEKRDILGGMV